jgi:hypothetical protein
MAGITCESNVADKEILLTWRFSNSGKRTSVEQEKLNPTLTVDLSS